MQAIIFANGNLHPSETNLEVNEDDLIIAADGGSRHCSSLGIIPNVLIGDLDSTNPELVLAWQGMGVDIVRYPEDKDQTDLELALFYAQMEDATKILVYGAIGGRLDMTLGNLTLLAHPSLDTSAKYIYGNEVYRVLQEGELLTLPGTIGDMISLITIGSNGSQVTAKGLEFPLEKTTLGFGSTMGISNRMTNNQATIHLEKGSLAVIHSREQTQGDE
jgi:thiamine pyrophosphokinase